MLNNENKYIDNEFNDAIAKTLKKFRLKKEYSLEELANRIDNIVSRQMLFKYENGCARIKLDIFNKICYALDTKPEEVWKQANTYMAMNKNSEIKKIELSEKEFEFAMKESYDTAINYSNITLLLNSIPSEIHDFLDLGFEYNSYISEEKDFGLFPYSNMTELYDELIENNIIRNGSPLTSNKIKNVLEYISNNKEKIKLKLKHNEKTISENFEKFKKTKYYKKYLKEKQTMDEIFNELQKEKIMNNKEE